MLLLLCVPGVLKNTRGFHLNMGVRVFWSENHSPGSWARFSLQEIKGQGLREWFSSGKSTGVCCIHPHCPSGDSVLRSPLLRSQGAFCSASIKDNTSLKITLLNYCCFIITVLPSYKHDSVQQNNYFCQLQ